MKFRGGQHITYLVWGILALMLVAAWPQVMLFVIFTGYALLGPAERLVGLLAKMAGKRPATKTEQSVIESKF